MQLPLNNSANDPEAEPLRCPSCREPTLHQYCVASYIGRGEDSELIRLTEATGAGTTITEVPREKHHCRRDASMIHFWCEACDRNPVLRIMQHKGQTFLEWMPERFERTRPGWARY